MWCSHFYYVSSGTLLCVGAQSWKEEAKQDTMDTSEQLVKRTTAITVKQEI